MKVFCDIDGVLADFVSSVFEIFGMENLYEKEPEKYSGQYEIRDILGVTKKEFWKRVRSHTFWKNLAVYPDAKKLISVLENHFGKNNIYLLSSPSMELGCYSGKLEWVQTHFPYYTYRTILFSKKEFLARPDTLLIDDSPSNIEKFWEAGGNVFLYRQHWNNGPGNNIEEFCHKFDIEL